MLKHSGLPHKFLDCHKNKSFFKLVSGALNQVSDDGVPTPCLLVTFPLSLLPVLLLPRMPIVLEKFPFRVSHTVLLWFCVMVMLRVLSCAQAFLAFPPPLPLFLFALTLPRRLAATALSGMVNTDLLPLLPLESMLLPWLLYQPPLHPHAKPLNIRRRSKSTLTIPKWDTATSLMAGRGQTKGWEVEGTQESRGRRIRTSSSLSHESGAERRWKTRNENFISTFC
jgi:hypothetical protein